MQKCGEKRTFRLRHILLVRIPDLPVGEGSEAKIARRSLLVEVQEEGGIVPFIGSNPMENIPYAGVLFATDRRPAVDENKNYMNERGGVLRLGSARIELGTGRVTWEEARKISLMKNRTEKYPLKVNKQELKKYISKFE